MKHKKEVDEYFRNLARYEQDEAYQEYIAELARIIEPGVQGDIKRLRQLPSIAHKIKPL